MNPRLNCFELSPELSQKLFQFSQMVASGSLGKTLLDLLNIRASQINGCAFCLDMHCKEARIHGEHELRLYHVAIWRESPLFSMKERAALEWTEAITVLPKDGISDSIYENVRGHFSEEEIVELTFAIGIINIWNRLNISFKTVPGSSDEVLGLTKAGLTYSSTSATQ